MQPEALKLLLDMTAAADRLAAISDGRILQEYLSDQEFRWAVERGFEIIGEALTQLRKIDAPLSEKISDFRKIISFRNVLIHGYSQIDDGKTWDILQNNLPALRGELKVLTED